MYKKYEVVYMRFLDHSEGSAADITPFECEVFGVLRNEDTNAYYICPWIAEKDLNDLNTDCYVILKPVVLEIKKLRVAK